MLYRITVTVPVTYHDRPIVLERIIDGPAPHNLGSAADLEAPQMVLTLARALAVCNADDSNPPVTWTIDIVHPIVVTDSDWTTPDVDSTRLTEGTTQ